MMHHLARPMLCLVFFLCLLTDLNGLVVRNATAGSPPNHPRIGLVLGGGGARGLAHIGVLRLLEELRIPVDCVAGTSMGSIIGGLYAAGMNPTEMETALNRINWPAAFSDSPPRADLPFRTKQQQRAFLTDSNIGIKNQQIQLPQGLLEGQNLLLLLEELSLRASHIHDFDRLKIPYRAVATDLATGAPVVLKSGDLAKAMRASMSIPSALAPVELDGQLLIDGGVSNNVPVDVVRALCQPEIIIAVDVGAPLAPAEQMTSVLSITNQLTSILTVRTAQQQLNTLGNKDILITPELKNISSIAFERSAEAIAIGYAAALTQRERLRRFSLTDHAYQARLAAQPRWPDSTQPIIDFIRIEQDTQLADEVIAQQLHIQPGERLNVPQLNRNLNLIYGMGQFQQVSYALLRDQDRTGLIIKANQKYVGSNTLDFGLYFGANLKGESLFNISAAYTQAQLNSRGGIWRNFVQMGDTLMLETDLYQPLSIDQRYFINPYLNYRQYNLDVYREAQGENSSFRVREARAGVEIGKNLEQWGQLALGLRYSSGSNDLRLGQFPSYAGDFNNSGYSIQWSMDTLDNLNFPTSGTFAKVRYYSALSALGADQPFQTLSLEFAQPYHWGKVSLIPRFRLADTLAGDLGLQDLFLLGGFLNLSGYQAGQITGEAIALGEVIALYRLDDASAAFTLPLYVGGALEIGGAWNSLKDIRFDSLIPAGSLFLGADTPLGPFFLGGGLSTEGNASLFLTLGRLF